MQDWLNVIMGAWLNVLLDAGLNAVVDARLNLEQQRTTSKMWHIGHLNRNIFKNISCKPSMLICEDLLKQGFENSFYLRGQMGHASGRKWYPKRVENVTWRVPSWQHFQKCFFNHASNFYAKFSMHDSKTVLTWGGYMLHLLHNFVLIPA